MSRLDSSARSAARRRAGSSIANKILLAAALALVTVLVAVAAGCGSSDSTSSSPSASAAGVDKTKAYKIGISQIVTHPALDAATKGFKDELAAEGFTNITYDDQNAQGDIPTTASIAQKFAGDGYDLYLGVATPTAQARSA